jgi:hypothetical protein
MGIKIRKSDFEREVAKVRGLTKQMTKGMATSIVIDRLQQAYRNQPLINWVVRLKK